MYALDKITADRAKTLLKNYCGITGDDGWWEIDRAEWKKQTGKDPGTGKYYRLKAAMDANSTEQIRSAVSGMVAHGVEKTNIKTWIAASSGYKEKYLDATGDEKVRLKNAMIMAYKAIGVSESEANKIINGWKKKKSK